MPEKLREVWTRAGWRADLALAVIVGLTSIQGAPWTDLKIGLACASATTCVGLVLRRRAPLLVALFVGAVWFVPGALIGPQWANAGPETPAVALIILAFTVSDRVEGKTRLLGVFALLLGFSAGDFSDPVPMFVFMLPAAFTGAVVQSRRLLAVQLQARVEELDEERDAFAREAVRYERARIARELHDIVAHNLSMMVVQAGAGQRQIVSNPAGAAESLTHIKAAADHAEAELSRLLMLLDGEEPVAPSRGALALVGELVQQASATGLSVSARFSGAHDEIDAEVSDVVYRVAQEGLTNALKHAPGAHVEIAVDVGGDGIVATIENGFARDAPSKLRETGGQRGLHGMAERVGELGGTLEAGPTDVGGWRVQAVLPAPHPLGDAARDLSVAGGARDV